MKNSDMLEKGWKQLSQTGLVTLWHATWKRACHILTKTNIQEFFSSPATSSYFSAFINGDDQEVIPKIKNVLPSYYRLGNEAEKLDDAFEM